MSLTQAGIQLRTFLRTAGIDPERVHVRIDGLTAADEDQIRRAVGDEFGRYGNMAVPRSPSSFKLMGMDWNIGVAAPSPRRTRTTTTTVVEEL